MYSAQTRSFVGSNPTLSTSWPEALTHSPSPGPKKCGVLSKGFLASKSKPVSIPFSRARGPVRVGRGELGLLPDRTQGAGVSRRLAGEVYGVT